MKKQVTIEAVVSEDCTGCISDRAIRCSEFMETMTKLGFPNCGEGYIYKEKDQPNEPR